MKKMILFIALIATINGFSQTNYYVANNGSDTNNGTTVFTPFLTIQKALNSVTAGDSVYIRGGEYKEYLSFGASGTIDNRITITSYPGELAVINGELVNPNLSNPFDGDLYLFKIYGDFITLKNLELKKSASFGIYANGADNIIIDNVEVHHGYLTGIYLAYCNYGKVTNCKVHDLFDYDGLANGGNADGIASSSGNPPVTTYYGNHVFENNLIYNCSDDGIDTWTSRNNTIKNNIVRNVGIANGNGNAYKIGPGGYNTVVQNVAFNFKKIGFDSNPSLISGTSTIDMNTGNNNILYNNTIYSTIANAKGFVFKTNANILKNNISTLPNELHTSSTEANNSWNLNITDPNFASTDPNSTNFLHLECPSPAIDSGVNVGLAFNGSAPDLGVYEYNGPMLDRFTRVFLDSNTDGDGGTDSEDFFTSSQANIYTGDYNGDGKTDLFVKGYNNVRAMYLARSTGDGFTRVFLDSNTDGDGGTDSEDFFTSSQANIYTGDYNGDGKTDLFVKGYNNVRAMYLARSTGDGFTRVFLDSNTDGDGGTDSEDFFTSSQANIYTGDYNGDGKTDLFVKGYNNVRAMYLARSTGDGFTRVFLDSNTDGDGGTDSEDFFTSSQANIYTGDYNGDGKTDLFVKGYNNVRAMYLARSTGDGFTRVFLDSNTDGDGGTDSEDFFTSSQANIYTGDYNGDGKTDLFVKGYNNVRAMYLARSTGDGFTRVFLDSNTDGDGGTDSEDFFTSSQAKIYTGDYNGDGKTDLFVKGYNNVRAMYLARSTGDGFTRVFLDSNTDGDGGTDSEDFFTSSQANIYTGDYNGDGKTDLFVKGYNNVRAMYVALKSCFSASNKAGENIVASDTTFSLEDIDISVYPNPTKGIFKLNPSIVIERIEVYTINQRKLKIQALGNNEFRLIGNYKGLAIIKIVTSESSSTKKIIFQ